MTSSPSSVTPFQCRILCFDDNQDVADSEVTMLELAGFESQACYDGPSALKVASNYVPKLCFIDLNMPGMDGDELAKRFRSLDYLKPLALVAVTAMNNRESQVRIERAGFDAHMVKPVDPNLLIKVVETFCKKLQKQATCMA